MSGIPSWAVPGAKVVCVDDRPEGAGEYYDPFLLQAGVTYIVAGGSPSPDCIRIVGHPNRDELFIRDHGYGLFRFRPVVEDKSDNEIEARLYQKRLKSQVISPKRVLVE